MAENQIADLWDEEDEFDPLAVDDLEINQEDMDDDNPLDTVDYPTMRNMPEDMQRESVYSPERQGGAVQAVLAMLDHNPARRPVLVSILGWCEGGCVNSELTEKVDALQADNRSVYGTTTLCRKRPKSARTRPRALSTWKSRSALTPRGAPPRPAAPCSPR